MSLVFSCTPPRSQAARSGAAKKRKSGAGPVIDIHCHVVTPAAGALVKDIFDPKFEPYMSFHSAESTEIDNQQAAKIGPLLTSVAARLTVMDREGIDIQAVSTAPGQYYYWADAEIGRRTARLINDNIASIVAGNPERFVGLATVPMQAPELAVAELTRAVKELGLRGVEIGPNIAGAELSEERFRPFFAKAEELGILIFMHPHGFTEGRRLAKHFFSNIIGNPLDTTIAVHHLIFGGVLEAYPKLKICLAHGGGFAASYSGRMDHAHGMRPDARSVIAKKPTSYLKKLYFDTIVFTHHQLEYLTALYGSDHILLGTDYPFDMALPDPVGFVSSAKKLSPADKACILGGNAAKLLGLKIPQAAKAKRR
jgi:aminocarboxymuconate-semialdehyde decarboxylase